MARLCSYAKRLLRAGKPVDRGPRNRVRGAVRRRSRRDRREGTLGWCDRNQHGGPRAELGKAPPRRFHRPLGALVAGRRPVPASVAVALAARALRRGSRVPYALELLAISLAPPGG